MNSNDLITVAIPAYNHEKYVKHTLQSIIDQTYANIELIIINDGSTDNTHQKIESMLPQCRERFKRVEYFSKKNEGVIKTLNICLEKAQGIYVYIIASDDVAENLAIEKLHDFLKSNPEHGLAVGENAIIDSLGQICYWTKGQEITYKKSDAFALTFGEFLKKQRPDVEFCNDSFGSYETLLSGNYIPNGYLIRKKIIEEIGGYSHQAPLEDLYLMLQLSKRTRFKFINLPLFRYRWHNSNAVKLREKQELAEKTTLDLEYDYAKEHGLLDFTRQKTSIKCFGIRLYEKKKGRGVLKIRILNFTVMRRITKSLIQSTYILGFQVIRKKTKRTCQPEQFQAKSGYFKINKQDFKILCKYIKNDTIKKIRYQLGLKKKRPPSTALKRLMWLDEFAQKSTKIIKHKVNGVSIGPKVHRGGFETKSITLPPINLYPLKDATFVISESSFLLRNSFLVERVSGVRTERCDYGNSMEIGTYYGLVRRRGKIERIIPKGIHLGGNGAWNYYHWMIEILPKIEFFNRLGDEYLDYPLLVSESVRKHSSFQEALDCFSNKRSVIYLDEKKCYTVENLLVLSTPSQIPFDLIHNEPPRVEDFLIRPESIHYIRDKILSKYKRTSPEPKRRIFFTASRLRRTYNEEEVFKVFEPFGFEKCAMDELNLKEQVELMQNAEMIAGPTGASWTNLIFCNPGISCLCWMDEFIDSFSSFSNIAHILNLNLKYIFYKSGEKSTGGIYSASYNLDVTTVKETITELLK